MAERKIWNPITADFSTSNASMSNAINAMGKAEDTFGNLLNNLNSFVANDAKLQQEKAINDAKLQQEKAINDAKQKLEEEKFEENKRQFNENLQVSKDNYALDLKKFNELVRQFGITSALEQAKHDLDVLKQQQSAEEFKVTSGLNQARLDFDIRKQEQDSKIDQGKLDQTVRENDLKEKTLEQSIKDKGYDKIKDAFTSVIGQVNEARNEDFKLYNTYISNGVNVPQDLLNRLNDPYYHYRRFIPEGSDRYNLFLKHNFINPYGEDPRKILEGQFQDVRKDEKPIDPASIFTDNKNIPSAATNIGNITGSEVPSVEPSTGSYVGNNEKPEQTIGVDNKKVLEYLHQGADEETAKLLSQADVINAELGKYSNSPIPSTKAAKERLEFLKAQHELVSKQLKEKANTAVATVFTDLSRIPVIFNMLQGTSNSVISSILDKNAKADSNGPQYTDEELQIIEEFKKENNIDLSQAKNTTDVVKQSMENAGFSFTVADLDPTQLQDNILRAISSRFNVPYKDLEAQVPQSFKKMIEETEKSKEELKKTTSKELEDFRNLNWYEDSNEDLRTVRRVVPQMVDDLAAIVGATTEKGKAKIYQLIKRHAQSNKMASWNFLGTEFEQSATLKAVCKDLMILYDTDKVKKNLQRYMDELPSSISTDPYGYFGNSMEDTVKEILTGKEEYTIDNTDPYINLVRGFYGL